MKKRLYPPFFDRKVQAYGYTRALSLGKVLPKDWRYVRIYVTKATENEVHLVIRKLLGVEANACPPKISARSRQNT